MQRATPARYASSFVRVRLSDGGMRAPSYRRDSYTAFLSDVRSCGCTAPCPSPRPVDHVSHLSLAILHTLWNTRLGNDALCKRQGSKFYAMAAMCEAKSAHMSLTHGIAYPPGGAAGRLVRVYPCCVDRFRHTQQGGVW